MSDHAGVVDFVRPRHKKRSANAAQSATCLSREDFDVFAREYADRLLAVAARMLRSPEDAADAVQDALLAAYQARHRFRGQSTVYTWLYRIVTNTCLMKLRALRSRRTRNVEVYRLFNEDPFDLADTTLRPPGIELELAEEAAVILARLKQLADDQRTILLLRDIEGLDTSEIARHLCISQEAVKARVCRARQALRLLVNANDERGRP